MTPGQISEMVCYHSLAAVLSGSSSAVERQLPKLDVAGSIPVSRSIPTGVFSVHCIPSSHTDHWRNGNIWEQNPVQNSRDLTRHLALLLRHRLGVDRERQVR